MNALGREYAHTCCRVRERKEKFISYQIFLLEYGNLIELCLLRRDRPGRQRLLRDRTARPSPLAVLLAKETHIEAIPRRNIQTKTKKKIALSLQRLNMSRSRCRWMALPACN